MRVALTIILLVVLAGCVPIPAYSNGVLIFPIIDTEY